MTIHATLSTTGNPHTSRRVDDDYGGCLDMRDEEYRARLTLIAMPTKRKQESDLTHVARVSKAARTSAPSSKANKTGANTTSLNANACARRGFSSISGEAEHGDEVAKSESIPLWKSAEERTAALNAMITSATPLHAMTTSATPHLPRPSTVESSRSSLFNLAKLDTGTHPGTHTAYPLPKRPAVTIDAAAIAVADHFLATFEFSSGDMLNVEGVNRSVVEGRRLYIGNLDFAATQVDLNEFFKDYNVESTSILIHARTDNQVGYAFVNVSHPYDANRAVLNLHGKFVRGRRVSIQLARILDEPQQSTHELVDLTRKRKLDDSLRDCL